MNEIATVMNPFLEWEQKYRREEFGLLFKGGEFQYGYEGAEGWLDLIEKWQMSTKRSL